MLTFGPILRAGVPLRRAAGLTVASDTISIATMELVDNAFILIVPGAIAAGLSEGLFWWSLFLSLAIAFVVVVPVNRWLIARGRGHAVCTAFTEPARLVIHALPIHLQVPAFETGVTGICRARQWFCCLRAPAVTMKDRRFEGMQAEHDAWKRPSDCDSDGKCGSQG